MDNLPVDTSHGAARFFERPKVASAPQVLLFLAASTLFFSPVASAQQSGRAKLPVINKITSNGPTRGAFTGIIQTFDAKGGVLEVAAANGGETAFFPVNKKVRVSSIEGHKLKLAALIPGANVIVNYEQQGGRRTVQEITVVERAPAPAKKSNPSSKS